MQKQGWHTYHVYILTNQHKSVLYTGVTGHCPWKRNKGLVKG